MANDKNSSSSLIIINYNYSYFVFFPINWFTKDQLWIKIKFSSRTNFITFCQFQNLEIQMKLTISLKKPFLPVHWTVFNLFFCWCLTFYVQKQISPSFRFREQVCCISTMWNVFAGVLAEEWRRAPTYLQFITEDSTVKIFFSVKILENSRTFFSISISFSPTLTYIIIAINFLTIFLTTYSSDY